MYSLSYWRGEVIANEDDDDDDSDVEAKKWKL